MRHIRLGRTNLMVGAVSFGALPIQRLGRDEAARLLRKAYDNGVNFFDTANMYTDSEEKIGYALSDVRDKIIIATKSGAGDKKTLLAHVEQSLRQLKTDYIDLLQLHNPGTLPDTEDPDSTYGAMLEVQRRGWVRHLGITNHSRARAERAVRSGKYDTLQFPFTYLAAPEEIALAELAHAHDMGFICMKGMAGGLITNAAAAFTFIGRYPFAVPIWGVQREEELDEFLALAKAPPADDADMEAAMERDRAELAGNFCRSCGYCLPCPAKIEIPNAARMSLLLRRAPHEQFITEEWQEKMRVIENCTHCNHCKNHCPYGIDTPQLLADNLEDYRLFCAAHGI